MILEACRGLGELLQGTTRANGYFAHRGEQAVLAKIHTKQEYFFSVYGAGNQPESLI